MAIKHIDWNTFIVAAPSEMKLMCNLHQCNKVIKRVDVAAKTIQIKWWNIFKRLYLNSINLHLKLSENTALQYHEYYYVKSILSWS